MARCLAARRALRSEDDSRERTEGGNEHESDEEGGEDAGWEAGDDEDDDSDEAVERSEGEASAAVEGDSTMEWKMEDDDAGASYAGNDSDGEGGGRCVI